MKGPCVTPSPPWLTPWPPRDVNLQLRALQASLAEANSRALAAETQVQRLLRQQAAKQADAAAAVVTSPRSREGTGSPLSPTTDVAALQAALDASNARLKEALARASDAEATLATQQAWHASELEAVRAEAGRHSRELEDQLKAAKAAANVALAVADRARRDTSSGATSTAVVAVSSADAGQGSGRLAALSSALEAERQRAAQAEVALRRELEWAAAETEAKVVMATREVAMHAHGEITRLRAALAAYEEQLREARLGGGHPAGDEKAHAADAPAIEAPPTDATAEAGGAEESETAQAAVDEAPSVGVEMGVDTEPAAEEACPEAFHLPSSPSEETPLPAESRADAPDDGSDAEPAAESLPSGGGGEGGCAEPLSDAAEGTEPPPGAAPDAEPEEQQTQTDAGPAGEASADEGAKEPAPEANSAGPPAAAKPPQAGRKTKPR